MIGDDYLKDICGGVNAGWDCAWYSQESNPCPALLPLHHIEFTSMDQLPDLLVNLDLPPISESINWLINNHSNINLILRSQAVASVSYLLAVWLRNHGHQVDPVVAHRGRLLHDIAKSSVRGQDDFETDHAELGHEFF